MTKPEQIEELANAMLTASLDDMKKLVRKALNSGSIDTEAWEPTVNPMILPKSIVIAVLETEAGQYKCEGTSFEKEVRDTVKNLKHFL